MDLHLHQDRPRARRPARPTRCATSRPRPARTSRTSPVTDTDEHCTDIVHPAINVKKTPNRTTATVGDTIGYRFDVTNPGDIGLAVTLSDPRCDAGTIAGPQKVTGDADNSLEPGELWRYTCTHKVTASDPDPLPNTVHVTGKDPLGGTGGTVEDEDSATVDLTQPEPPKQDVKPAPQQQVLAAQEQSQAPRPCAAARPERVRLPDVPRERHRPADPPRDVLRGRSPRRHPHGPATASGRSRPRVTPAASASECTGSPPGSCSEPHPGHARARWCSPSSTARGRPPHPGSPADEGLASGHRAGRHRARRPSRRRARMSGCRPSAR